MENRRNNMPWALLSMLLGVVLVAMSITSYLFVLRIVVAIAGLVLIDYGMGVLGLPTLSQLINNLFSHFKKQ